MQRVDGYYLYTVGSQIQPLHRLKGKAPWDESPGEVSTYGECYGRILVAAGALKPFLNRSIFRLRTSQQAGQKLLEAILAIKEKCEDGQNNATPLDWLEGYQLNEALTTFEAILQAEMALLPLYVVMPKAGYDITTLIENGVTCFPADIEMKVPEAVADLREGTKCIAFELNTAAGFHLHRANESVIRRYWDIVTKGKARPPSGNMGNYLHEMKQGNFGDVNVRAALDHIVKFHRNPLIHPEQNIESSDDAIGLMNSIHTAVVQMLKVIPADPEALDMVGGMPLVR
jgi:hypothetical protein